jgi:hypothetical protein
MDEPFLTIDELASLDALLGDARYEARIDERAGRTHDAERRLVMIADVQGIIDRHRAYTLRQRDAS